VIGREGRYLANPAETKLYLNEETVVVGAG
jgi:hypothetical protein